MVRSVHPNERAVFCDTGLEFESVRKEGLESEVIIKPDIHFTQVISKYGYPAINKEQSQFIHQYRTAKSEKTKRTRIEGNSAGRGKISNKWIPLTKVDFMISDQCCNVMKKKPFKKFEKKTGRVGILGVLAAESQLRLKNYLEEGCNALNRKRPYSMPLGFWTEQDILKYIKQNNIKIPKIYGDIIEVDLLGTLELTGEPRTGCIFCLYGCHKDGFSKFKYLEENHPKVHDYCMRGGKFDERGLWVPHKGLGMKHVIEEIKKGYMLNGKVIRPSYVIVAKGDKNGKGNRN